MRAGTLWRSLAALQLLAVAGVGHAAEPRIVNPGDPMIADLDFTPFIATYDNYDRQQRPIGTITTEIKKAPLGNGTATWWICTIDMGDRTVIDSIAFAPKSLAPVYRSFPHARRGYHFLHLDGARVSGFVRPLDGGPDKAIRQTLDGPFFEVSLLDLVLAALPLKEGLSVRMPCADYQSGKRSWAEAAVRGKKQVDAGKAGKMTAWQVDLNFSTGQKRTLWITPEQPFRVRADGGWNWRLSKIEKPAGS